MVLVAFVVTRCQQVAAGANQDRRADRRTDRQTSLDDVYRTLPALILVNAVPFDFFQQSRTKNPTRPLLCFGSPLYLLPPPSSGQHDDNDPVFDSPESKLPERVEPLSPGGPESKIKISTTTSDSDKKQTARCYPASRTSALSTEKIRSSGDPVVETD